MRVEIDQVWATPSTLHCRVIVHDDNGRWRHKYYPSIPLDQVPEEALRDVLLARADEAWREDMQDIPLFDLRT